MSIRVDWFGFVEGVAADARGMYTLVGFSPKFHVAQSLPTTASYSLVLELSDDEKPEPAMVPGRTLILDLTITAPDGSLLVGTQQSAQMGEKTHADLPGSVVVFVGAVFNFRLYGRHRAEVSVSIEGTDIKAEAYRDLHIVPE
jgi:hypothetical protein